MPHLTVSLSLLLSLLLMAPRAALAEAVAPENGPFPRTELPASLHLLEDLAEPAPAPPPDYPALRMILSLSGAALTGSLLAATGYSLGLAICSDALLCLEPFFGLLVGGSLGVSLGAWWGGALAGGQGVYWSSAVGTGLGTIVGIAVVRVLGLVGVIPHPFKWSSVAVLGGCAAAGAMAGYEIAHRVRAPALHPLVAVTSGGAALGLGGSF
jgi:hypothetical protein